MPTPARGDRSDRGVGVGGEHSASRLQDQRVVAGGLRASTVQRRRGCRQWLHIFSISRLEQTVPFCYNRRERFVPWDGESKEGAS